MLDSVLYFPSMSIRSPGWLKSSLLLWDHIYRIVPEGVRVADTPEVLAAADEGLVRTVTLEKAELLATAESLRRFIDKVDTLPDGLDDASNPRRIHRKKIDETFYPVLEELAHEVDQEGWLHLPPSVARAYMFHLSLEVAHRRNMPRATDDSEAWAVAPFFSEDGNFNNQNRDKNAAGFYAALTLGDVIPASVAIAPIRDVIDFNIRRRDIRQELRTRVSSLADALSLCESREQWDDLAADFIFAMERSKQEFRDSLGFGNAEDIYSALTVGLPVAAGTLLSSPAAGGSVFDLRNIGASIVLGAVAAYAHYGYVKRKQREDALGSYLVEIDERFGGTPTYRSAWESFEEFMND